MFSATFESMYCTPCHCGRPINGTVLSTKTTPKTLILSKSSRRHINHLNERSTKRPNVRALNPMDSHSEPAGRPNWPKWMSNTCNFQTVKTKWPETNRWRPIRTCSFHLLHIGYADIKICMSNTMLKAMLSMFSLASNARIDVDDTIKLCL